MNKKTRFQPLISKTMKKLLTLTFLVGFVVTGFAQKSIEKADKSFSDKDYYKAIEAYQKILDKGKVSASAKQTLYFKLGESHKQMNHYDLAAKCYEDAITLGFSDPKIFYQYAEVLARSGQYEEALAMYDRFLEKVPDDSAAVVAKKSCQLAREEEENQYNKINTVRNEQEINSQQSDFAPAWYGEDIVFTSTRQNKLIDARTGEGYADLFKASLDKEIESWRNPELLKGALNSKYNEGAFAYDTSANKAFFMRTDRYGRGKIYMAAYEKGKWKKAEQLNLCPADYSAGHPALGNDGKTLYFVSDMPGGIGGRDIWMVRQTNTGVWGEPQNLGENINTEADEMFPFILNDELLYFASSKQGGYGGLDIYCSEIINEEFQPSENLGFPFNTYADDFSLIINPDLDGGLFSSNRKGGSGSDDIYSFTGFPMILKAKGNITDFSTEEPIANATVSFFIDSIFFRTTQTDTNGNYFMNHLQPNVVYNIIVTAEKYFDDSKELEVDDEEYIKTFCKETGDDIDFALIPVKEPRLNIEGKVIERQTRKVMPSEILSVNSKNGFADIEATNEEGKYAFAALRPSNYVVKISKVGYWSESRACNAEKDKVSRTYSKENDFDMDFELTKIEPKKEITLNNIFYDYNKATLRPESKVELNKVVSMLKETPNISIQISAHTDVRGSASYNMKLSGARAKSVVSYLKAAGISSKRLRPKGYGESRPLIKNATTEEQHQQNRRTTFKVIKVQTKKKVSRYTPKPLPLYFKVHILTEDSIANVEKYFEKLYRNIPSLEIISADSTIKGMASYEIGSFKDLKEALELKNKVKSLGFTDCILVPFHGNKRVSIAKAIEIFQEADKQKK